jgi:hypothetical protein
MNNIGLQLTVTRWLPGDLQPASSHMHLVRPTLVLDVVDKSGVVGPTGTVFDGLLKLGNELAADGVTEIINETAQGEPPQEYDLPGFFGTVNTYPWVSWRNGMRTGLTGIQTWEMTIHKALAGAIVTGGHSPGWVNAGIQLLLNGALGYLGTLFGNAALGAVAANIIGSQVEDTILAFQRVANPLRQAQMGRDLYSEAWVQDPDTAYSLGALQAIQQALWNTRAYTSFKVTVVNGAPYWVGMHFDLGDRVSAEIGDSGQLYVDNVYELQLSWSRTQDPRWEIQIGNGNNEKHPGAILAFQIENVKNIIQMLTVSS